VELKDLHNVPHTLLARQAPEQNLLSYQNCSAIRENSTHAQDQRYASLSLRKSKTSCHSMLDCGARGPADDGFKRQIEFWSRIYATHRMTRMQRM